MYLLGGSTGVSLSDVLGFWTGAKRIPPLGFPKEMEVAFVKTEGKKLLPAAHTCGMIVRLWEGYSDADIFAADMTKAVRWGGGFHLV